MGGCAHQAGDVMARQREQDQGTADPAVDPAASDGGSAAPDRIDPADFEAEPQIADCRAEHR
jgi:hypothetical protein